jgi:hypothetical protein
MAIELARGLAAAAALSPAPLRPLRGTDLGDGGTALTAALAQLGVPPPAALADPPSFARWQDRDDGALSRLFRRLGDQAAFGRSAFRPLDAGHDVWVADALVDRGDGFAAAPCLPEGPAETGPLARQRRQALVADLLERHGNGILTRMAARLVELAGLPERIGRALAGEALDGWVGVMPRGAGIGHAAVECARGRLHHLVALEGDIVRGYTVLAPTEWNFHPEGALVSGLLGQPADGPVGLLVAALDPCAECTLSVEATDA